MIKATEGETFNLVEDEEESYISITWDSYTAEDMIVIQDDCVSKMGEIRITREQAVELIEKLNYLLSGGTDENA